MTSDPIPVIDLFAGPGGLGEGFAALGQNEGTEYFSVRLSVEKDPAAHETLLLRSFFRQFPKNSAPREYYSFIRGEISKEKLYDSYLKEAECASEEAWLAELGGGRKFDEELDSRISKIISGHDKWVLIGGPPCQAYSVIGRARNSGSKNYKPEEDKRNYLYKEYLRIIAKHRPTVFVMENVKGLLSSEVKGIQIFKKILSDLQNPTAVFRRYNKLERVRYRIFSLVKKPNNAKDKINPPEDYVVHCEKYGIPQTRHRIILLGVRIDLGINSSKILKPEKRVNVESVIAGMPKLRSGLSKEADSASLWKIRIAEGIKRRWVSGARKKWGCDFYSSLIKVLEDNRIIPDDRGKEYIAFDAPVAEDLKWWYYDSQLNGVCNHASRSHFLKDIYRYIYAACFAKFSGRSPLLDEYPPDLLPKHKNAKSGHFADRFRVQVYGRPSATITSHISKDGHYYIHPDPFQGRSLTVREAARLQTFPDNYFFCGKPTQQYVQVGNAVPPLLAMKIADIVRQLLNDL